MDSPHSLRRMQHRWNFLKEKEDVYEIHNNKIYGYFTIKIKGLTFTLNLDSKKVASPYPKTPSQYHS